MSAIRFHSTGLIARCALSRWQAARMSGMPPRRVSAETPGGEPLFDSGVLNQGDSLSITFPEAATYSYTCSAGQDSPGAFTLGP